MDSTAPPGVPGPKDDGIFGPGSMTWRSCKKAAKPYEELLAQKRTEAATYAYGTSSARLTTKTE